ncbi:MAG: nitroreductase [Taibaiella sp.]|nr:nitroreductase [Taibaiella sp.]
MAHNKFETVSAVIKERRSTKAASMNGNKISQENMDALLELANWAPTHGRTQPWHFIIYTGQSLIDFGTEHAELHKTHTPAETYNPETYAKLQQAMGQASHMVIAVMKRGENPKIPLLEEIAACAAAVQNILIGATAMGIASFWSSGGFTHHKALHQHLQLAEHDMVMGLLYLGYTDEPAREGKRATPITDRIVWNK